MLAVMVDRLAVTWPLVAVASSESEGNRYSGPAGWPGAAIIRAAPAVMVISLITRHLPAGRTTAVRVKDLFEPDIPRG